MMGWGNCGTDSQDRPIGYYHAGTCDQEACNTQIDRGIDYACGGMHGGEYGCEGYFCGQHQVWSDDAVTWASDEPGGFVCPTCAAPTPASTEGDDANR